MPFVQIFHGWDADDARAPQLGDGVHRALVDAFGIPPDDHFQALCGRADGMSLRITPAFLGVRHTADAVFVQITCAPGRTLVQKQALYAAIVHHARAAAGLDPQDVIVNLVETARENWSFGDGQAQFAS